MSEQQVKMPTVEELRLLLRKTLEQKKQSSGISQKYFTTLQFIHSELIQLGSGHIYHEEIRRNALIEHGYNPPDNLKAYSVNVDEKQSNLQSNLYVPLTTTPPNN